MPDNLDTYLRSQTRTESIAESKKARPNGSKRNEKMGICREIATQVAFSFILRKK